MTKRDYSYVIIILRHKLQYVTSIIQVADEYINEGPEGDYYSHFPAQILTESQCPRAQIPSSQWLRCSNLNPIPIFYCFFAKTTMQRYPKYTNKRNRLLHDTQQIH